MSDEAFRVKLMAETSEGERDEMDGRGMFAFVLDEYSEKADLSSCKIWAIGELDSDLIASEILHLIDDETEDEIGDLWRHIIARVIRCLHMGIGSNYVPPDEAFAQKAMAEAETEEDDGK